MPILGLSEEGFASEDLFNLFGSYAMSKLNMKRIAFIPLKIVNAQRFLPTKSPT
jgi:peptidase E